MRHRAASSYLSMVYAFWFVGIRLFSSMLYFAIYNDRTSVQIFSQPGIRKDDTASSTVLYQTLLLAFDSILRPAYGTDETPRWDLPSIPDFTLLQRSICIRLSERSSMNKAILSNDITSSSSKS